MEIVRTSGFTRLSSNIVQENREAPEPVQSGRHLVGSCHHFERTGWRKGTHVKENIDTDFFIFKVNYMVKTDGSIARNRNCMWKEAKYYPPFQNELSQIVLDQEQFMTLILACSEYNLYTHFHALFNPKFIPSFSNPFHSFVCRGILLGVVLVG